MATSSRAAAARASPRPPACRAYSRPATSRTTSTGRRSPAPAAAAWRHSTRRSTWMGWSLPEAGEPLKFLRPGHSPDLLKKLRRGQWSVDDELDLHGLNRVQVGYAVSGFLEEAVSHGMRCVRIVHGKGSGVLREALRADLPAR